MKNQPNEELEAKYGPNWAAVAEVLRVARSMTDKQREELAARFAMRDSLWTATQPIVRDIALNAVRTAAYGAGRDVEWAAVWTAVWDAGLGVARDAAWGVAQRAKCDAAIAACVKDLIDRHGFTYVHYDTLMVPWSKVFGDPFAHPPEA